MSDEIDYPALFRAFFEAVLVLSADPDIGKESLVRLAIETAISGVEEDSMVDVATALAAIVSSANLPVAMKQSLLAHELSLAPDDDLDGY